MSRETLLFLRQIENRLKKSGVVSPSVEAEDLVKHFGGISRTELFTGDQLLAAAAEQKIKRSAVTRAKGVPLAYITGEREFCGRKFFVNRSTLIPRLETEILVEQALKAIDACRWKKPEILDLGTGSGCIAVSLTCERPACKMTALELSREALKVARKNIDFHGLRKKIKLVHSDLFGAFEGKRGKKWDVIVSNPPYVPAKEIAKLSREVQKEPRQALDGGPDGLDVIREILEQAPSFLKAEGRLLIEIGAGQSRTLKKIISRKDFKNVNFVKDYSGIDRILIAQKN